MNLKTRSVVVAAALSIPAICASTAAMAEGPAEGFYLGGGVGAYTLDIDDVDFKDDARFLRGAAGYKFNENLAVEGDYMRLSKAKDDVLGVDASVDTDAWGLAVRPMVPLGESVDLYGRVGWTWYDTDFSATALGLPVDFTGSGKGDDFTWGGGLDFHFTENLSLRGDFTRIEVDKSDLNLVSAQLMFRF